MLVAYTCGVRENEGVWEMNARRHRFVSRGAVPTIGAALVLAALVAVIGSAQAAPQTKIYRTPLTYSCVVRTAVVTPTSATLTLTLTNRTRSQTLGSANFTPPHGVLPTLESVGDADPRGGTPGQDGSTVTFRSSNGLANGRQVSARCHGDDRSGRLRRRGGMDRAGEAVERLQRQSGNDFQLDPGSSDLIALGSFDIATIETVRGRPDVPAILDRRPANETTTTAYDICGKVKAELQRRALTSTLLTSASYVPLVGLY